MMSIGVIGAGTMGSGIAEVAAQAGNVVLVDVDKARAEQGLAAIEKRLNRQVERERIDAARRDELLGRIAASGELADLRDADIVIEAALEDLEVKGDLCISWRDLLPEVHLRNEHLRLEHNGPGGPCAPAGAAGGHPLLQPRAVMKLVEIVRTPFTSQECLDQVRAFTESLGKEPVLVEESPGFIVNRLLIPMINEAVFLLSEGAASAEDIDTAMRLGANHPMGPLSLADLVGLDICLAIMETLHRELGEDKYRPAPLLRKMVRAGHLGRKTKKGFFEYN